MNSRISVQDSSHWRRICSRQQTTERLAEILLAQAGYESAFGLLIVSLDDNRWLSFELEVLCCLGHRKEGAYELSCVRIPAVVPAMNTLT